MLCYKLVFSILLFLTKVNAKPLIKSAFGNCNTTEEKWRKLLEVDAVAMGQVM